MGYQHIENLYKEQTILMFRECYALEKIHGTSAHIKWKSDSKQVILSSGGASHVNFSKLFDTEFLKAKFLEGFQSDVTIYGEAYGGSEQGMSGTYGKELKFVAFDIEIDNLWLNVPAAENICQSLNIEFVDYVKIPTTLEAIDAEKNKPSTQAIRNGILEPKLREGVVLRPLIELRKNNDERILSKHKKDEFKETKTPREVSPEQFAVLTEAKEIAEEWVTETRLQHVLDKLPQGINIDSTKLVISAMLEDVYREAKGEIVESQQVAKEVMRRAAILFKNKLKKDLEEKTPQTAVITRIACGNPVSIIGSVQFLMEAEERETQQMIDSTK